MAKVSIKKGTLQKADGEVKRREREKDEFEIKVEKAKIELRDLEENKKQYKKRLDEMPKAELTAAEKKKLAEVEKLLSALRQEEDKVRTEARGFEDKIYELHEKITNAGGQKLQDMKANVAKAKKERDDMDRKVKKYKIDAEQARKNAAKSLKLAEQAEKTLATSADREEKREKIMDQATQVMAQFQQMRDKDMKEREEAVTKLTAVRTEKLAIAKKAKDQKIEAEALTEGCRKTLQECERKVGDCGKTLLA